MQVALHRNIYIISILACHREKLISQVITVCRSILFLDNHCTSLSPCSKRYFCMFFSSLQGYLSPPVLLHCLGHNYAVKKNPFDHYYCFQIFFFFLMFTFSICHVNHVIRLKKDLYLSKGFIFHATCVYFCTM